MVGSRRGEIQRNNLLFHSESGLWHTTAMSSAGELLLRTAQNMIVENDDILAPIVARDRTTRAEVIAEICHHLAPFKTGEGQTITAATVISKDLTVDSLAVMDMVMELEDRFDISIPMNMVVEIRTVGELADTILALRARR